MLTKSYSNARKIAKTLTRQDIVRLVAAKLGQSEKETSRAVEATIDTLSRLMRGADPELRIELRGLGVFEVKFTKASGTARNPRTGEKTEVPLHRKTHFRASKIIKRVLQKEWPPKTDPKTL